MKRYLRGFLTASTTIGFLAFLVLTPLLLAHFFGWPLPRQYPNSDNIQQILQQKRPVPDEFVVNLFVVALWVLWIHLIYTTAVEFQAMRRGLTAKELLTIPGLQRFVTSALFGLTLILGLFSRTTSASASSMPPISTVQPQPAETLSTPDSLTTFGTANENETVPTHTVKPGESWWQIAEDRLGSGTRWKELRDLNIGKTFGPATITHSTEFLGEGWKINLPQDATGDDTHTVKPGETLSEIAHDHLEESGQTTGERRIAETVEEIVEQNQIKNKDVILPGQRLDLPQQPEPAPPGEKPEQENPPAQQPAPPEEKPVAENPDSSPGSEPMPKPTLPDGATNTPDDPGSSSTSESELQEPVSTIDGDQTGAIWKVLGGSAVVLGLLGSAGYRTLNARQSEQARRRNTRTNATPTTVRPIKKQPKTTRPNSRSIAENEERNKDGSSSNKKKRNSHVSSQNKSEQLYNLLGSGAGYNALSDLGVGFRLLGAEMQVQQQDAKVSLAVVTETSTAYRIGNDAMAQPIGFEVHQGQEATFWQMKRPADTAERKRLLNVTREQRCATPTVISVGEYNQQLFVADLETIGGVNIVGDPADVWSAMKSIVLELALIGEFSDTINIVIVSPPEESAHLRSLQRVSVEQTLSDDLVTVLTNRVAAQPDDVVLRRLEDEDSASLEPTVVICPDPSMASAIRNIKGTIPVVSDAGASKSDPSIWTFEVDQATTHCPQIGLSKNLKRPKLSTEEWQTFWELWEESEPNTAPRETLRSMPTVGGRKRKTKRANPRPNHTTSHSDTRPGTPPPRYSTIAAKQRKKRPLTTVEIAARTTLPVAKINASDQDLAPIGEAQSPVSDKKLRPSTSSTPVEIDGSDLGSVSVTNQTKSDPPIDKQISCGEISQEQTRSQSTQTIAEQSFHIRVLGPIEIVGYRLTARKDKPWRYQKTPELILLLATSPRHQRSGEELRDRLWPGAARKKQFNGMVSEARNKVLVKPDGTSHLPKLSGSRVYQLEEVTTDVDRFEFLVDAASKTTTTGEKIELLSEALHLIRGRPFDLVGSFAGSYAWLPDHVNHAICLVEDAAARLARIHLEQGEYDNAIWAAQLGLSTETGNEELLSILGTAALVVNDVETLGKVFADIEAPDRNFGADPEEPQPETSEELVELRNQIKSVLGPQRTRRILDVS